MTPLTIAIDGPAAAGKGTLARALAAAYRLPYLDTGKLYRAVGRKLLLAGVPPDDVAAATRAAQALQPADLDRTDLRGPAADRAASQVAAIGPVRAALLAYQRAVADRGAVLDGRDIGTVVLPHARLKLFVTASVACRARRRWAELPAGTVDLATVEADIATRDAIDMARAVAPLRPAADAIVIDTTPLSAADVLAKAQALVDALV